MRCESKCFPLGSRCGWDCYLISTQTSENGIRLNETDKDGYSLLFEKEIQQKAKKGDR